MPMPCSACTSRSPGAISPSASSAAASRKLVVRRRGSRAPNSSSSVSATRPSSRSTKPAERSSTRTVTAPGGAHAQAGAGARSSSASMRYSPSSVRSRSAPDSVGAASATARPSFRQPPSARIRGRSGASPPRASRSACSSSSCEVVWTEWRRPGPFVSSRSSATGRRASIARPARRRRAAARPARTPRARRCSRRRSPRALRPRSARGARARRRARRARSGCLSGRKSRKVSSPGWSRGASASEPGGSAPRSRASSSASSVRDGTPCASPRARIAAERSTTSSRVARISRGGGATKSASSACERWLAGSKSRTDSTSSPSSSIRTGCARCGGNTSTMPPRTATSPRSSTTAWRA